MKGIFLGMSIIALAGLIALFLLPLDVGAKTAKPTECKVTGTLSSCSATFNQNTQLYDIKGACSCSGKGSASIDGHSANNACLSIDCNRICKDKYCSGGSIGLGASN